MSALNAVSGMLIGHDYSPAVAIVICIVIILFVLWILGKSDRDYGIVKWTGLAVAAGFGILGGVHYYSAKASGLASLGAAATSPAAAIAAFTSTPAA